MSDLVDQYGRPFSVSNPFPVLQTLNNAAISGTNPEPNISNIQQLILNGQSYSFSSGKVTAAVNMAGQWLLPVTNPKNVIVWSVRVNYSNANQPTLFQYITADDTAIIGAGVSTVNANNNLNLKAGGAGSASLPVMKYNGGIASPSAGTPLDYTQTGIQQTTDSLTPGMFIYIPALTAAGIAVYTATTAAGGWCLTVRYTEL